MVTTTWPQRPPEPDTDLTVGWESTPREAVDLTRLRRELRALVRHQPWRTADDADLDRLLLIVEELASNGLRHGRPPVRVCLARVPSGWLVDVSDEAIELPPAPADDRDAADGGMGLPLVARLSAAHGWTVDGERKHVWARIDTATLPPPAERRLPAPRQPPQVGGDRARGADSNLARIGGAIDDGAALLGFRPTLRVTGPLPELTRDILTDLLAVLGEAITNAARHARAEAVHVEVLVTVDDVIVRVRDDGIGPAAAPRTPGLNDLGRRAAWHGGTLDLQPEPAGGARLTWAVPRRPGAPNPRPPS